MPPHNKPPQNEEIKELAEEFESCLKILTALGDENRQHLILEMMKIEQCYGARVGTITENRKADCTFSLLKMSRKPPTVSWLTTENSLESQITLP